MVPRLLAVLLVLSTLSFAGITDDVREALYRNNVSAAESELQSYRARQGVTPDYLEALSWMARANLASRQFDRADDYARQTESLSRQLLAKRPLDAERAALTAQGRMSAYVLVAMPFLMGLAIFALNPKYMSVLFTSSAGKVMICISLVMMAIGGAIIRKIVSFKG